MASRNQETNLDRADKRLRATPSKRTDGELYARPEPDPFHPNWCEGYDDGLAGCPRSTELFTRPDLYSDGYEAGCEESKIELGSSNA